MNRKLVCRIMLTLLLASILPSAINIHLAFALPTESHIEVPFHYQDTTFYCGEASMEMVFDFYGPDVSQYEIADAARADFSWGTTFEDMRRAAHFSNLSLSRGKEMPGAIQGYSSRTLGYSAFEKHWLTLDDLKLLINNDYPGIVATWYAPGSSLGHYRVVVGYNETHITFHDPWILPPYTGPDVSVTNSEFLTMWDMGDYWGLFVCPWNVTISGPDNVQESTNFTVTAVITYPCPDPFFPGEYIASSCNATLILPEGLNLDLGETAKKTLGTGILSPGSAATVSWVVQATTSGDFTLSVEAEGEVFGHVHDLGPYLAYDYEDRIGGTGNHSVFVYSTLQDLIETTITTIEMWQFPKGTENSLLAKLKVAIHALDMGKEDGAMRKLTAFINRVEMLKGKTLTDEQADYLTSEAQRIIDLIQG